jgi:predicted nuclease of predicted toxin-antitoxin system
LRNDYKGLQDKDDGYVIVTRDADFQELSLIWGQPPKVIRLKTLNQSRAATLKVLLENRDVIIESLVERDLASVEIVPA